MDDALEDIEHGRRQLLGRELEVGQLGPLRNIPDEPTQASLVAVAVRASLCTPGEIIAALLYARVSRVGTLAGLWTTSD